MTPEGKVKKAFADAAKEYGLDYINLIDTGERGNPDKIALPHGGPCVFVEFKAGKQGRLSKHQVNRISELRALGYQVEIIDNEDDAREWVIQWTR